MSARRSFWTVMALFALSWVAACFVAAAVALPLLRAYGVVDWSWWLCCIPIGALVLLLVTLLAFELLIRRIARELPDDGRFPPRRATHGGPR